MGQAVSPPATTEQRLLRWGGRFFYLAALVGLAIFGTYIVLRATGAFSRNFRQWGDLLSGAPLGTAGDWIANLGIGMHYFMGAVLVLAWPLLFSARIRARQRAVHRWVGRIYVAAGFLAGVGGMSFILARHDGGAAHVAFAIWGAVMMLCAVQTYLHARAKRFVQHRAWAIRTFAVVLGSWLFDLELFAWIGLTGGIGMTEAEDGPVDYLLLYFFFVPNLLVAELFIRNQHRKLADMRRLRWPLWAGVALVGVLFVYSIGLVTATPDGKYGKFLHELAQR